MENELLLAELKEMKQEIKESRKEFQDTRERLGRMEEKLDVVRGIQQTADLAKETANKALLLAESSHQRINELKDDNNSGLTGLRNSLEVSLKVEEQEIARVEAKVDKIDEKVDEQNKWLMRSSLSALLIACLSLIGFIFSLVKLK